MNKKNILLILLFWQSLTLFSQVGRGIYRFLELPVSSKAGAIGGHNVSLRDNDISFALMNPALLTSQTHGVVGLNMAKYLADIKFGNAIYGHNFGNNNYSAFGVQYVDFGQFAGYDELNQYTENFTAKDIAIYVSYARPLNDYFTIGGTLKPIFSAYERYTSLGVAMDIGINYNSGLFSAGLVIKNAGVQLKGYYSDINKQHREPLPFDLQIGITKKFEHAPLRISLTAHNLHRWRMDNYQVQNNTQTNLDGVTTERKITFFDTALRHLVFGVEFVPSDNFFLAAGYNHRRSRELSIDGLKNFAGFSFGTGIKLYKFQIGFGITRFQAGNNAYQFSLNTNLNEFIKF